MKKLTNEEVGFYENLVDPDSVCSDLIFTIRETQKELAEAKKEYKGLKGQLDVYESAAILEEDFVAELKKVNASLRSRISEAEKAIEEHWEQKINGDCGYCRFCEADVFGVGGGATACVHKPDCIVRKINEAQSKEKAIKAVNQ